MGKDKKRGRDSDSEEEERKKKKDRKHDSSSSSDSDSDKGKKKKKEKKKEKKHKHKKDKKSSSREKPEPISMDDYFAKNPEFRMWLTAAKKKVFGDLSESECKKYFKKFVEKYNDGELTEKIYKGVSFAELDKSARTTHKWGFAKEKDSFQTDIMKDKIFADTQNATLLGGKPGTPSSSAAAGAAAGGVKHGMTVFAVEEQRERERAQMKLERKGEARRKREELEELAPKPDPGSFQARMEKRAQKGHYCRERPASPDMKDSDLMGGDSGHRAAVERQKDRREAREEAKRAVGAQKLEAHNQKEKEKMNEFRKMMGLPLED
mmetsp:Transcript_28245/g.57834  ORF Transcript_28245/g.57834 Transcript_28245/m.57834 type:complete len:321 (-) Transcript_28245:267-1229(-)|eukprot:CAMPEP_0181308876 /NCGR_PEP_ID=MMETSP1101-20121128/11711_1 /TAXON_ID=46948 /ORGANISM="Rhodomonas abbreviata, Strain Caron Lab Isolate" /LENGTH=320 /DNA_ID=CAMNT_0023415317 /DNA_START=70 /DNA_END=1032 /DNA_ORIENTATION=+